MECGISMTGVGGPWSGCSGLTPQELHCDGGRNGAPRYRTSGNCFTPIMLLYEILWPVHVQAGRVYVFAPCWNMREAIVDSVAVTVQDELLRGLAGNQCLHLIRVSWLSSSSSPVSSGILHTKGAQPDAPMSRPGSSP